MGCSNSTEQQAGNQGPAVNKQQSALKAVPPSKPEKPKTERAVEWERVRGLLPIEKNADGKHKRFEMFKQWDPNSNGKLSLAEIDKACREILLLQNYTNNLAPILIRAYNAAITKFPNNDDSDFIEINQFRILLFFIYHYFELMQMFDEIDTSDDRRITLSEFKKSVPLIEKWGLKVTDADALFNKIDANKGGFILFEEFADFGANAKLDADGIKELDQ